MPAVSASSKFLDQPKAIWATTFACVVGFMSIGHVDPVFSSIVEGMNASPSRISLLFSSYFLLTSIMMLATDWVSSRSGVRNAVLIGTGVIVVFAALAELSGSVAQLVIFRAGWGLGNALFVATALSVIATTSRRGKSGAILMSEAALGLGICAGLLLDAALGTMPWHYPFFGTAVLMTAALFAVYYLLPALPKPQQKTAFSTPIKALGDRGLRITAVAAFFYNYGFFTVLVFVPFALKMSPFTEGMTFLGWGLCVALFSMFVAPRLKARFSAVQILSGCLAISALLFCIMAVASAPVIASCVVAAGAQMGVCNTVFTELALSVSDQPDHVASAAYQSVRWFSGVIASLAAAYLAETYSTQMALFAAVLASIIAITALTLGRHVLHERGRRRSAIGDQIVRQMLDGTASGQPAIAAQSAIMAFDNAISAPSLIEVPKLQRRPYQQAEGLHSSSIMMAMVMASGVAGFAAGLLSLLMGANLLSAAGIYVLTGAATILITALGHALWGRHADDAGAAGHTSAAMAKRDQQSPPKD